MVLYLFYNCFGVWQQWDRWEKCVGINQVLNIFKNPICQNQIQNGHIIFKKSWKFSISTFQLNMRCHHILFLFKFKHSLPTFFYLLLINVFQSILKFCMIICKDMAFFFLSCQEAYFVLYCLDLRIIRKLLPLPSDSQKKWTTLPLMAKDKKEGLRAKWGNG